MSYLCPSCNSFPTEEQRVVGFSWGRSTAAGRAVPVPVKLRCSKRMRWRKVCVETWPVHSRSWQTSRKMAIVQFRVLLQAFVKEAGKALWKA